MVHGGCGGEGGGGKVEGIEQVVGYGGEGGGGTLGGSLQYNHFTFKNLKKKKKKKIIPLPSTVKN